MIPLKQHSKHYDDFVSVNAVIGFPRFLLSAKVAKDEIGIRGDILAYSNDSS
jgi:hypothetical protein